MKTINSICLFFCLPFLGFGQGQVSISPDQKAFLKETIAYYQVADALFSNEGLKLKSLEIDN